MAEKILVVDDERPIAEILRYNLEREGYEVALAYDGEEALARFAEERPDLVILDIMLPKRDGLAVCRELRRDSSVPILMLTARDGEPEKVQGLELGADDYVTKPFGLQELLARVRAILRRATAPLEAEGRERLQYGALVIDQATRDVLKDGRPLGLTVREFELLVFLVQRSGRVFTREELLEQVWGYQYYGDIRTVDVTVRRLREKIEDDPSRPVHLITRRGVGYMMRGL